MAYKTSSLLHANELICHISMPLIFTTHHVNLCLYLVGRFPSLSRQQQRNLHVKKNRMDEWEQEEATDRRFRHENEAWKGILSAMYILFLLTLRKEREEKGCHRKGCTPSLFYIA